MCAVSLNSLKMGKWIRWKLWESLPRNSEGEQRRKYGAGFMKSLVAAVLKWRQAPDRRTVAASSNQRCFPWHFSTAKNISELFPLQLTAESERNLRALQSKSETTSTASHCSKPIDCWTVLTLAACIAYYEALQEITSSLFIEGSFLLSMITWLKPCAWN